MKNKILIIEDEIDQIMVLKTRLEANGYKVISATNGHDGLKTVEKERPNLILLDIVMPGLNGYEVCKRLKSDDAYKKIPIVIVSASGEKQLEEKCNRVGVDGIIQKPYESESMLRMMKDLLGKQ
ncbi:MAG: response regulator [Candidatus Omnitrophota bacterium]